MRCVSVAYRTPTGKQATRSVSQRRYRSILNYLVRYALLPRASVFPVVAPALTFQYYAQPVVAPVFPVVAPALT
ncbi:hypothetical protein, partial [Nostoc sp.]|uniref:hypothetical protein n=1 Tax=Nostoc sp. TaxID=1180 RepID=UPI002FF7402A